MKTAISISNDLLTIGEVTLNANSHVAEAKGTDIIIVHVAGTKSKVFMAPVSSVTLNSTAHASTAAFCAAFNALAKSTPEKRSMDEMKSNTDYPDTLFSAKVTVGAEKARVANYAKPGYIEVETNDDNTGTIYIGDTNVTSDSAHMAAGKKRFFEIDDLSKIYVLGSEAGQILYITGAYKN